MKTICLSQNTDDRRGVVSDERKQSKTDVLRLVIRLCTDNKNEHTHSYAISSYVSHKSELKLASYQLLVRRNIGTL